MPLHKKRERSVTEDKKRERSETEEPAEKWNILIDHESFAWTDVDDNDNFTVSMLSLDCVPSLIERDCAEK